MRQRFVQSIGGTLLLTPPEAARFGVPTSATISITASDGTALPTIVSGAVAAISSAGELSYALSGAQCPDPFTNSRHLYRAVWRYVIAGVTYETDQLYEVRRRVLKSTLTYAEVERDLPADVYTLQENGPADVHATMGDAWDDVLDDLASRGVEPDKVMDADRLRRPHRQKTIARLARTWGPQWKMYADEREASFERAMDRALASGDWIDASGDATEAAGPDEHPTPATRLTR